MGILRLSHVDVRVPDLDLATAYYTEVLGLLEVERGEGEVYLKCWDEPDHHSVRLSYAPRVGLHLISFRREAGIARNAESINEAFAAARGRTFLCLETTVV